MLYVLLESIDLSIMLANRLLFIEQYIYVGLPYN